MSDSAPLSDVALVHRVVTGNAEAADLFVARFTRLIWWILIHEIGLDREPAGEVYQDVFVRLWRDNYRGLRSWTGEGDFASYLAPIVRHLAFDRLRGRRRGHHEPLPDPDDPGGEPRAPVAEADELAWIDQQRALLDRAVAALGARDRRLYELRFVDERSYQQIGAELGITINHVGVRISRLCDRLRESVADRLAPGPGNDAPGVRSPGRQPSAE